uniref:Uncharacterized protein n=1 Tax=Gasterosteus aculeatus TaxID=69293 RepID=G3NQP2_GASAC
RLGDLVGGYVQVFLSYQVPLYLQVLLPSEISKRQAALVVFAPQRVNALRGAFWCPIGANAYQDNVKDDGDEDQDDECPFHQRIHAPLYYYAR